METENESNPVNQNSYQYYFTSSRQFIDGKETGETVEKKEKL
jgi:hypothetical protein